MENHVGPQQMPEIYMTSIGVEYKRKLWPENLFMDLRHALDPVLARLGRPEAIYTISKEGEAIVTVQTRMGLQRYSSDTSASSVEAKKWMAVSRALEQILLEEDIWVRDPSYTDLLWTRKGYEDQVKAMRPLREEVNVLQRQITYLTSENERLNTEIDRLRNGGPDV